MFNIFQLHLSTSSFNFFSISLKARLVHGISEIRNEAENWISRNDIQHRIHANAARFHRPKGSTSSHQPAMKGKIRDSSIGIIRTMGHRRYDSCVNTHDYSCCLNGKVKEVGVLENLKVALGLIQASSEFITDERVTMVEIEGIPLKVWNENTFIRIASKWGTLLNVENLEKENYHCKRLCVLTKSMSHIFESFKINYKGKTHWVRAIEIPGWTPDLDDQNDEESDSEDEECEEVFKKDFGESDEEVQGENDVSRVSDTEVEEENPKSKDGVVSMFYTRAKCAENVEMDNQKDNCDGEFGNVNNISDEVNFSSGFNTYKKAGGESMDSDHCRESEGSRKGGSILMLMDELVKVGQTMGYNMDGCMKNIEEIIESQGVDGCFGMNMFLFKDQGLNPKAKKDWVKELCVSNKVNFLTLQETKMESIDLFEIKRCWGNFAFDYVHSASVGKSGGILCVWDPNAFKKLNSTVSDYFVMIQGNWVSNGKLLLIILVYAPQELSEKKSLWDYLCHVIDNWKGSVIIMGDFNEVRNKNERFRTIFNVHGANAFNSFISMANLEEVPLGGCSFTMGVTIASKMIEISKKEDTCLEWHETKSENSKTCAETESSLNLEMIMTNEMRRLSINLSKSKLLGVVVSDDRVVQAANRIGCGILKAHFAYLGSKVGGNMSQIKSWDEIVDKMVDRLSKWKMKTLSIGGRLTLLRAVLGSMPIYHMSIFKVPMKVLQRMESIRSRFFSGVDLNSKKSIWVKWSKVLCSKEKGGLGGSTIHGEDGENGSRFKVGYKSIWLSILQEVETLKIKGIHLNNFMQKKLGNGADTYFWEDLWHGDMVLKQRYPRLYAPEVKKTVDVASKLSQENLTWSFRRAPRSGVEQDQLTDLMTYVEGVVLGVTPDRWYWTLDGSGEFSVASARKVIDDNRFPKVSNQTRWIKAVPIKVNIHAWKRCFGSMVKSPHGHGVTVVEERCGGGGVTMGMKRYGGGVTVEIYINGEDGDDVRGFISPLPGTPSDAIKLTFSSEVNRIYIEERCGMVGFVNDVSELDLSVFFDDVEANSMNVLDSGVLLACNKMFSMLVMSMAHNKMLVMLLAPIETGGRVYKGVGSSNSGVNVNVESVRTNANKGTRSSNPVLNVVSKPSYGSTSGSPYVSWLEEHYHLLLISNTKLYNRVEKLLSEKVALECQVDEFKGKLLTCELDAARYKEEVKRLVREKKEARDRLVSLDQEAIYTAFGNFEPCSRETQELDRWVYKIHQVLTPGENYSVVAPYGLQRSSKMDQGIEGTMM
ncbi:RNA-directed DNA polymerase, eukaryota [Tanacetum coccineum]